MKKNWNKFLPIGSVVMLKNTKKPLMIMGYLQSFNVDSVVFDYIGCLFPEGVLLSNKNPLFNHNDIDTVIYRGYVNDDTVLFHALLKKGLEDGANVSNNN